MIYQCLTAARLPVKRATFASTSTYFCYLPRRGPLTYIPLPLSAKRSYKIFLHAFVFMREAALFPTYLGRPPQSGPILLLIITFFAKRPNSPTVIPLLFSAKRLFPTENPHRFSPYLLILASGGRSHHYSSFFSLHQSLSLRHLRAASC